MSPRQMSARYQPSISPLMTRGRRRKKVCLVRQPKAAIRLTLIDPSSSFVNGKLPFSSTNL